MNSQWTIIIRYGEIGIKGRVTRRRMEKILVKNITSSLATISNKSFKLVRSFGRIYIVDFENEEEINNYLDVLTHVMGIVSLSPAYVIYFNDLDDLVEKACIFFMNRLSGNSFAVRVRRIGKHVFTSMDVARKLGEVIVKKTGLKVNLSNPEYTCYIEIRGNRAYLYDKIIKGPGGLPIGSEGKVLVLFSGGIDSPVATWFTMRRGCEVDLVLFNIAGSKQVDMVKKIAYVLMNKWCYGYKPKLYVIDLKPLLPKLLSIVPENYVVVLLRRLMMRIASKLADRVNAKALVTGENLGQVASQTLDNLVIIDSASDKTVLRPLIGFDKNDIVKYAELIGTYEYSSKLPEYCLIGTRRVNPHADLNRVIEYEEKLGFSDSDIENLINNSEIYDILDLKQSFELNNVNKNCLR